MIQVGEKIDGPTLYDQDNVLLQWSDLRGGAAVLYIYPKDDTPGCSAESMGFRDLHQKILDAGAKVFGISADGDESHRAFRQKYNLPFRLLCDPGHQFTKAIGAWGDKGRRSPGGDSFHDYN